MCDNCMQSPALFQNIFKFCTFLLKFPNVLPFLNIFLPFFWKITCMPLLSRTGPVVKFLIFCNSLVLKSMFHISKNESKGIHTRYVQYQYTFFHKVVYKLMVSIRFFSVSDGFCFCVRTVEDGGCNRKIWDTLMSQK